MKYLSGSFSVGGSLNAENFDRTFPPRKENGESEHDFHLRQFAWIRSKGDEILGADTWFDIIGDEDGKWWRIEWPEGGAREVTGFSPSEVIERLREAVEK